MSRASAGVDQGSTPSGASSKRENGAVSASGSGARRREAGTKVEEGRELPDGEKWQDASRRSVR